MLFDCTRYITLNPVSYIFAELQFSNELFWGFYFFGK